VPEFAKRIMSTPKRAHIASATAVADGEGVTNRVPVVIASVTAATTSGWR